MGITPENFHYEKTQPEIEQELSEQLTSLQKREREIFDEKNQIRTLPTIERLRYITQILRLNIELQKNIIDQKTIHLKMSNVHQRTEQ